MLENLFFVGLLDIFHLSGNVLQPSIVKNFDLYCSIIFVDHNNVLITPFTEEKFERVWL